MLKTVDLYSCAIMVLTGTSLGQLVDGSAYLQMLCAELAGEELVLLPHVLLQLLIPEEDFRL